MREGGLSYSAEYEAFILGKSKSCQVIGLRVDLVHYIPYPVHFVPDPGFFNPGFTTGLCLIFLYETVPDRDTPAVRVNGSVVFVFI